MRVSVLLCTWNRARILDQTLAHMERLRIPEGVSWEIVVVDNRSTDATQDVLAWRSSHLPLVARYEPRPGKSFAANRAVEHSTGELLIWTDDDVVVDPGWLATYVQAAEAWPNAVLFAGSIEPIFENEPPRWLQRNRSVFGNVYGEFRPPADGTRMRPHLLPFGANMATRREVFERTRFNTDLGPVAGVRVGGEETELCRGLLQAGCEGRWVASARVQHFNPTAHLTRQYVWDYWVGMGRTDARLNFGADYALLAGAPRWAVRKYLTARLALRVLAPVGGRRWARAWCEAAKMKGLIVEWRRLRAQQHAQQPVAA
jgi:GT2 family glycosyltransferase